jgi:DNA-binding MarR family transcriptional regulator
VSEAPRVRRLGRGGNQRPSPAALGVVRDDPDFAEEFPDGDATCCETHASLGRTGSALLQELERCMRATFDLPQTAANALAVIDGAGGPISPSQISERTIVPSATMTATLDLLENRGLVVRRQNPEDRRGILVEVTDEGRALVDSLLAGVRAVEVATMSALTLAERKQLLRLLSKVLASTAAIAAAPPITLEGRRFRPERLG